MPQCFEGTVQCSFWICVDGRPHRMALQPLMRSMHGLNAYNHNQADVFFYPSNGPQGLVG